MWNTFILIQSVNSLHCVNMQWCYVCYLMLILPGVIQLLAPSSSVSFLLVCSATEKDKQMDRRTDGQTDGRTDWRTDGRTDGQQTDDGSWLWSLDFSYSSSQRDEILIAVSLATFTGGNLIQSRKWRRVTAAVSLYLLPVSDSFLIPAFVYFSHLRCFCCVLLH